MLEVKHLVKTYSPKGGVTVRALDDVSIVFPEKGMVFLLGKSGSGKSTLLNVAGGLDKADSGEIIVKGKSSKDFSASDFDSYRNTCVGFVFQEYNLLNEFSVEQNVALALQLQNKKNDKAAVNALLERVDLKGLGKRKPSTLSGGQKQRVAIARALIKEPEIIMADEPTGALDSTTGRQILDTFKKLSKEKLVVIVSHDREFAEHYADRIIELADGKIISDATKTYSEPTELESGAMRVVAGDTVTIENADKINENDLKTILEIIKKNGGKAIIATDERKIENVKKACKINEDGSAESFETTKPTEPVEYDGNSTKFIKSKLPASHAIRIGASGLKTKPIRLVFTALLSVVAFSLFGVLSAFMTYDRDFSFSKALQKTGNPAAKVITQYEQTLKTITVNASDGSETIKSDTTYGTDISVSKNDLKKLNDNDANVKFAGVFGLSEYGSDTKTEIGVQVPDNDYYPIPYFTGFSDCGAEFLKSCGYTLSTGRYPENKDEIAVTEYVDGLFKAAGKGSATDNSVKITVRVINEDGGTIYKHIDVDLKIVGVYKTKAIDTKFDALKEKSGAATITTTEKRSDLMTSFEDYLKNSFNLIAFVSPEFYDSYVDKDDYPYDFSEHIRNIIGVEISYDPISGNVGYTHLEVYTARFISYYSDRFVFFDLDGNEIKNFDVNNLKLGIDEIYAPLEMFYYSDGEYITKPEDDNKIRHFKNYKGYEGTLNVKGYYAVRRSTGSTFSNSHGNIVSEEFIAKYSSAGSYSFNVSTTKYKPTGDEIYRYALAVTDNSLEQTTYILNGEPERDVVRTIDCEAYRGISLLVSLIEALSNVFLIAGLILGVFAALLLLNFISASISAKSKEIGILRAVGARGSDVFKIFFSEAFIFAFICFVLSSIGSAWLCNVINSNILRTTVVPTAELLNYNVLNIAFTLVVSLVVCALATFLPVFNAARKPPVEVSRG